MLYNICGMKKMTKNKEDLIGKLHRTISLMSCESRISRDYGTAHELTASDIDFLKCVEKNEGTKASDLSLYLGVTNGATTQLAKKLMQKGYVEPYRLEGNKKEVFYRLTDAGQTACGGFDAHYAKINQEIALYLDRLDEQALEQIGGLLDAIAESLSVGEHCSVQHGADNRENPHTAGEKKCEKCQKTY